MNESAQFRSLSRGVVVAACHAAVLLAGCSDPRENPASSPSAQADVPTITYHETTAFAGAFPWREPWSPTGHILVFNGGDGFYIFDADLPEAPPRRVATCTVSHAVWSPDGGWILGLNRPDVWTDRLLAIPLTGEGEVVDAAGWVRTTLRHDCTSLPGGLLLFGFSPHSLSADGRYLVGTTTVEDGHCVYESDLHVAYVESGWAYPIAGAPDGSWPYLSREGLLLAFRGLDDGLIHVGELEISCSQ